MSRTPARTDRLAFRELRTGDAAAVLGFFRDDAARLFYPRMTDLDAARGWIAWNRESYATHGFGLWGLVDKASGVLVGDCGLTFQPVEGAEQLEIGYHLAAPWRRRGLTLEAGRAVLAHAFSHTGEPLVCSIVAPANLASVAVAGKLHDRRREYRNRTGEPRLLFYTLRP